MAILHDYYNTGDNGNQNGGFNSSTWVSQTFTPTATYHISSVKLKLYKTNNLGTITVSVRAVDGSNKPTGSDLASGTTDGSTLTTDTAGEWREITFSSNYKLYNGTRYAIVIRGTETAPDSGMLRTDNSSPTYTNGEILQSINSGGAWTAYPGVDGMFECWGSVSGMPTDTTYSKKLVAFGNDEMWYESSNGTMAELTAANGDIDTTIPISCFEAYGKILIANKANLKVADFINVKLTHGALATQHAKGDLLTQDQGSGDIAYMVVDFTNAAKTATYGYAYYAGSATAFDAITVISGSGSGSGFTPTVVTNPPHWYDWAVYPGGSSGSMPNKAYLGCLYRGRAVISGNPEFPFQWYMSRQSNPWDFNDSLTDAQAAVFGGSSDEGEIGDIVKALIPYKDDFLIFACASSMWYLAGDPRQGGSINELDLTVGIFGAKSWCFDGDGNFYFWGDNGIYITTIPGTPKCISEVRLPDLINDEAADPSTHRITMAYDRKRSGIIICITKLTDGTNSNYWYSLRTGGFFPESYPDECGVYSAFYYAADATSYKDLVVGCYDGYIRKFDNSAKDDDTGASDQAIDAYVTFGPILLGDGAYRKGKFTAPNLITAGGAPGGSQSDSNDVAFKIFASDDAEKIIEDMAANTGAKISGTFKSPGRRPGNTCKQKVKAAYVGIKLANNTSAETWALDKFIGTIIPSGRIR